MIISKTLIFCEHVLIKKSGQAHAGKCSQVAGTREIRQPPGQDSGGTHMTVSTGVRGKEGKSSPFFSSLEGLEFGEVIDRQTDRQTLILLLPNEKHPPVPSRLGLQIPAKRRLFVWPSSSSLLGLSGQTVRQIPLDPVRNSTPGGEGTAPAPERVLGMREALGSVPRTSSKSK